MKNLMYVVSLVALMCMGFNNTFAKTAKKDTTIEKSLYKLNKKKFYEKYAKGDKEKEALIDHYFYRRKQALRKISALPIGAVIATAFIATSVTTKSSYVQSGTFYGGIFGVVGTLIGIPITIDGIKISKKYNRKKLYLVLAEIESGKKTTKDVLDNIVRYEVIESEDE